MATVSEQDASLIESMLGRESSVAAGAAAVAALMAVDSAMQVDDPEAPATGNELAVAAAQAACANAELQEALALAAREDGRVCAARPDSESLRVVRVHSELRMKLEKQREKERYEQAGEAVGDASRADAFVAEDGGQDDERADFTSVLTHVSDSTERLSQDAADVVDAGGSLAQSGTAGSAAYGTVMTQSRASADELDVVAGSDRQGLCVGRGGGPEEIALEPIAGAKLTLADFEGRWCKAGVAGTGDLMLCVKNGRWGAHGREPMLEFSPGDARGPWETNGWVLLAEKSSRDSLTWVSLTRGEERTWRRLSAREVELLPRVPPLEQLEKSSDSGEGRSRMRWCFCVPQGGGAA